MINNLVTQTENSKLLAANSLAEVNDIKKNNESMIKQIEFIFSQNIQNMKENRGLKEYINFYRTITENQIKERDDFIEVVLQKSEDNKQELNVLNKELEQIKSRDITLKSFMEEIKKDITVVLSNATLSGAQEKRVSVVDVSPRKSEMSGNTNSFTKPSTLPGNVPVHYLNMVY